MALFKNTKIFIDMENMVVSTDAIVASKLDDYFKTHDGSKFFFFDSIDKYKGQDIRALAQNILAEKSNYNFILDHFKWVCMCNPQFEQINPAQMCNNIYKEIMQESDKSNRIFGLIGSGAIMTSIAQSFKNLVLDEKLTDIYIYMEDWMPDYMMKGLNFFYGNLNKIHYVKGNKSAFIRENPCTTYFMSRPEMGYFKTPHPEPIEVFVPGSKFNTNVTEVIEGVELRELCTPESLETYEEYNTKVYTLFLPI